jgi:hypothetical protein
MQQHVNVCEELRQFASDDATFLFRVITGDESWIYGYDRDKATVLPKEKSRLTETEKGETGQEHAHPFLCHQGDCSQRIRSGDPNSKFCILLRCFKVTV